MLRRGVAKFFLEHRWHRLNGFFSLTLVIIIPKIPNICGFIFPEHIFFRDIRVFRGQIFSSVSDPFLLRFYSASDPFL